jgi:restriction system protein
MVHEDVQTGLIVTTSALEPGAARTSVSRGYRVGRTERAKLRKWIDAMRTPGTGLFLAD